MFSKCRWYKDESELLQIEARKVGTMEQLQDMQDMKATIKTLQERVEALDYELRAWQCQAHRHCPRCGKPSLEPRKPVNRPFHDLPLTDAVLMVLSEGDGRLGIRALREILEEKGMKQKLGRYGNSLRTTIARLVAAGRIQREGDAVEILK